MFKDIYFCRDNIRFKPKCRKLLFNEKHDGGLTGAPVDLPNIICLHFQIFMLMKINTQNCLLLRIFFFFIDINKISICFNQIISDIVIHCYFTLRRSTGRGRFNEQPLLLTTDLYYTVWIRRSRTSTQSHWMLCWFSHKPRLTMCIPSHVHSFLTSFCVPSYSGGSTWPCGGGLCC